MKSKDKILNEISRKYLLNPKILKNILIGKLQCWSQIKISKKYKINQNTISKYSRIIEREFDYEELKKIILIIF